MADRATPVSDSSRVSPEPNTSSRGRHVAGREEWVIGFSRMEKFQGWLKFSLAADIVSLGVDYHTIITHP